MKYINVKINDDSNVIISIDKEKYSIGTPIIIQSKEEIDYGVITSIYDEKTNIKTDDTYVFLRFANSNDRKIYKKNNIEAQKAFIKCRELIKKYKLPMKLIEAKYTFYLIFIQMRELILESWLKNLLKYIIQELN